MGDILEYVLPHKILTVNAIPIRATNMSPSEDTRTCGACVYQNTAGYQRNAGALCCKLCSIAFNCIQFYSTVKDLTHEWTLQLIKQL